MNFAETILFYLVIGLAVAAARWLKVPTTTVWLQLGHSITATFFWPLYLPMLLSGDGRTTIESPVAASPDDLAAAIAQVEQELNAALADLDGGPESALKQHPGRLRELRLALAAQAERIRRMETLLARDQAALPTAEAPPTERDRKSRLGRQENMQRLADLVRRSRADLLATLAWIRELVSMIHLAKFTGAPAARAEELVAQIAAAVESLAAATPADSPFSRGS
jgi:hypothetical protein